MGTLHTLSRSIHASVCLSVCPSVRPSVRPPIRPCLSVCLSVSVCPSVRPSVWVLYIIFGFVSTYACFMLCYAFVTPGHASVHPSALYWSELRVLYIIFGFVSTYACFMLCYACVTPWHASVSVCLSERSDMCPCLPVCLSVRPSVRTYVHASGCSL